jgi:hypothetical protein
LAEILKRAFDAQPPHIVVASGDIGWSGIEEDYTFALDFFRQLKEKWVDTSFVIAPGNHDLVLSRSERKQEDFSKFLCNFYESDVGTLYPFLPADLINPDDYAKLISFSLQSCSTNASEDERVLIVAVNSAAYIKEKGTPVFISPDILKMIEDRVKQMRLPKQVLRIFVLHHHLLPFAEPEWRNTSDPADIPDEPDPTIVANSAKLQAWLAEQSFHIVLHSHKHLSHVRDDILRRRTDPTTGRRLLIIGAGSVGVEESHRSHQEPLSYNLLSLTALSRERWRVDLAVKQILENEVVPKVGDLYCCSVDVGALPDGSPHIFQTEYMDNCHQIIKEYAKERGLIQNFISIVESSEYRHPKTTRIGGDEISQQEVDSSFQALHPEYGPSNKWTDFKKLDEALKNVSPRFQFNHGPRLFSVSGQKNQLAGGTKGKNRPITRAIENLKVGQKSRGYIGLFNPEIDTLYNGQEPLADLVGIQFILSENEKYLDVVATFRKVELLFWWVVNMYEIGKLLEWVAKNLSAKKPKPRCITFFAALAEWKERPEATFITQIDQMKIENITTLVCNIFYGSNKNKKDGLCKLVCLLEEKKRHTHENNLDIKGLELLTQVVQGLLNTNRKKKGNVLSQELLKRLAEAKENIGEAMSAEPEKHFSSTNNACEALEESIRLLRDT